MPPMLNKRALLKILRAVSTVIAVGLIAYLLWENRQDVMKSLRMIPAWRLAVVCVIMMVSRFAVACRWHVLLRSMGVQIPLAESIRLTFAGLFATNFLPTTVGGDIVRLAGGMKLRCDKAGYAASLVMDRIVGMAGMAVTLLVGLPMCWHVTQPAHSSAFTPVAGFAFGRNLLPKWVTERNIVRRVLSAFGKGLRSPRALFTALLFTWTHMVCMVVMISILLAGMDEHLSLLAIAGLWGLVYFLNLVPFSINGLGVQEVLILGVYMRIGGVSREAGLALAVLIRTLVMFGSLPGALFVPSLLPDLRSQKVVEAADVL